MFREFLTEADGKFPYSESLWIAQRMVRFSMLSLLLLIAVVALWLSTIASNEGGNDVRALLMLSVLVASGVAVTKYDGRRRAFWVGFFLTVLTGLEGKAFFGFSWAQRLLNEYGMSQILQNGHLNHTYFFLMSTIHAGVVLLTATMMGFLGVLIFEDNRQAK